MNTFLNLLISNVFVTACLFAILMVFRRRIKNPAVLHAVLLLILVKLITPAYWQPKWELLPKTSVIETAKVNKEGPFPSPLKSLFSRQKTQNKQPVSQIESASSPVITPTNETITDVAQPEEHFVNQKEEDGYAWIVQLTTNSEYRSFVITRLVMIAWIAGTAGLFLLVAWRIVRFQWFLRSAQPASDHVKQMTATLAARIGLKHVPKIEMVAGNISPLLWACFSRARIILPIGLLDQIDEAELETLLLHELAHYRRGDHWVRMVELLTTSVYWWYPVVWLVRRQIRIAEEQCCDAWVVQTLPDKRRAYAEVLVKAIGYVSRPTRVIGATGIGSAHVLEQRLKRIMCESLSGNISRRAKIYIAVIAVMLLPFAPMLGQPLTQTIAAEKKESLPTPKEILAGYHDNLKQLMPLAINYKVLTIENMNCINYDRRQMKGLGMMLKWDRSEFNKAMSNSQGQIPNDDYYRMVMIEFDEKKKRYEGLLTPEAIKTRLAEKLTERGYFWSDGESFHHRWPKDKTNKQAMLALGPVSPPENLKSHYHSVKMVSWSSDNHPPMRHWYGDGPDLRYTLGNVANDLSSIDQFKTLAPLGMVKHEWTKNIDWDNLDSFMSKDPSHYQVIRREDFNGRPTILVEQIYTPPVEFKRQRSRIRAWVDPNQGYLPLRIEWARIDANGKVVTGLYHYVEVLEVKKVADAYYPVRIKFQEYTSDSLAIEKQIEEIGVENLDGQPLPPLPSVPGRTKIWEVTEFTPNKVIEPAVLALDFPKGTLYQNDVDGRKYHAGEPQPLPRSPEFSPKLKKGDLVPQFKVASWTDGKSRKLSDFRGKVVVVLFMDISGFLKNWNNAQAQIPMLMNWKKQIYQKNAAKGVVFLDIHPAKTTPDQIREFQKLRQWETLAAIDAGTNPEGGLTFNKYNGFDGIDSIDGLDYGAFLIGRDGRLVMSTDYMADLNFQTYFQYVAKKLSISVDNQETLSEEKALQQSMRIMEFIISEQINDALAQEEKR